MGHVVLIRNGTALKVWEHVRISIKAVSREDPHVFGDLMIHPGHKIIFAGNLGGRSRVNARAVSEIRVARARSRSLEEV